MILFPATKFVFDDDKRFHVTFRASITIQASPVYEKKVSSDEENMLRERVIFGWALLRFNRLNCRSRLHLSEKSEKNYNSQDLLNYFRPINTFHSNRSLYFVSPKPLYWSTSRPLRLPVKVLEPLENILNMLTCY